MSMDLSVWSSRPFDLPVQLPLPKQWKVYTLNLPMNSETSEDQRRHRQEWAFDSVGWQVLVLPARRSEDNVPEAAVLQKLPDASHVAYVTLEPIGADQAGYAFLEKVVRGLALATGGVWVVPNGQAYAHNEGQFE
jgi:hypothetical protein